MRVRTVETDGCSVTTCLRGNKRACTLVKAGEQGGKLTEMRWGGKTEKINKSTRICFVVFGQFGSPSRRLQAYLLESSLLL